MGNACTAAKPLATSDSETGSSCLRTVGQLGPSIASSRRCLITSNIEICARMMHGAEERARPQSGELGGKKVPPATDALDEVVACAAGYQARSQFHQGVLQSSCVKPYAYG
jgi:hypothetical protein